MKHTDLAQDYFERHSQSDECFITSDGRVFHTYGHATSFAQEHQLQDQTIESYKRAQVFTDNDSPDPESEKQVKLEELAGLELVKENYQEIKALVKYFNLKPADQKAETLIAALTEYKNTLNS